MTQQANQATGLQQVAQKISQLSDQAFTLLSSQFRLLIDNEKEITVAEVTGPGVIEAVSKAYVVEAHLLNSFKNQLTPSKIANELYPAWRGTLRERIQPIAFDSILPFAFKSQKLEPEQYAWQRLSFDLDPNAGCPETFASLLKRTSAEEARSLVLFIGSLFDYSFPRSQYLYLHGEGHAGKSMLLETLTNMFSVQGVTTMRSGDFADKHSTTSLERARLLVFADQNNNSFMSSGHFKAVTGDDVMTINPKGQARRNIRLNCKVLIASNHAPNITGGVADERRILPVGLKGNPGGADHGFAKRFVADGPAIAQYCINEFAQWKAANPGKDMPASNDALDEVRAESLEALADTIVTRYFEFVDDPKARMFTSTLQQKVTELTKGQHALGQLVYKRLKASGMKRSKTWNPEHTKELHVWRGIRLRDIVSQEVWDEHGTPA